MRSPNASSPRAAACRSSCSPRRPAGRQGLQVRARRGRLPHQAVRTARARAASQALDRRRAHSKPPCVRSQICGWIRSAARSTATNGTSRSPRSSSRCSKFSSLPKAVSSAPKSSWNGHGMKTPTVHQRRAHHRLGPAQTPWRAWLIATVPGVGTASTTRTRFGSRGGKGG